MVSDSCYASMIHPGLIMIDQWFRAITMLRVVDHRGPLPGGRCRRVVYIPPSDVFPPEGRWAAMTYEVQELQPGRGLRDLHATERWPGTTWGNPRLREEVYSAPLCWISDLAHSMFGMCIWYIYIYINTRIASYCHIYIHNMFSSRVPGPCNGQHFPTGTSFLEQQLGRKMSQDVDPWISTGLATQVPHSVWRKVPLSVAQMWGAWDTMRHACCCCWPMHRFDDLRWNQTLSRAFHECYL